MTEFNAVTDELLAQARENNALRCQLVADHLEVLLATLSRLKTKPRAAKDPVISGQIKDGVAMAVRLADILQAAETQTRRKTA